MEVIPVIDIRSGRTVKAAGGMRARYRELTTPLAADSSPAEVAMGIFRLYPFRKLYVADLDAVTGHGSNTKVIADLCERFSDIALWLDAGTSTLQASAQWLKYPQVHVVIGSETLGECSELAKLAEAWPERTVLSLDYRDDTFLGPGEVEEDPSFWPGRVIVMALSRVGADAGPDLDRLSVIKDKAGPRQIYSGGGIRAPQDLYAIRCIGCHGALVASALHNNKIRAGDLEEIAGW